MRAPGRKGRSLLFLEMSTTTKCSIRPLLIGHRNLPGTSNQKTVVGNKERENKQQEQPQRAMHCMFVLVSSSFYLSIPLVSWSVTPSLPPPPSRHHTLSLVGCYPWGVGWLACVHLDVYMCLSRSPLLLARFIAFSLFYSLPFPLSLHFSFPLSINVPVQQLRRCTKDDEKLLDSQCYVYLA
jgi:hypothetical protein